ncbi:hypothetical protein PESP_b0652 [Pseudoalteromonas espejiana DSM 9414]|uniref:DUF6896 domain-containing protein n=1 Tax=Pseudoalteromonas espejiana TaxID=28107 RepID=A0A510XRG1_9GAMM|nr:hypothetical protein [Pseudoalteromonas espejiana]ASM52182.1 hypothetical protein PESP_b0652 [Pseudoalteromonas espejiana DSM 9414]GEK53600.1 hypothetical protein PES01_04450 [Pseudoalteromonas espejiana]
MTEHESMHELIIKWHNTKKWAELLICEKLNLSNAEDILLPENRGKKPITGTEWFYRTHGKGVDIFKEGNKGGIDFNFGSEKLDSYKLKGFMIKQLNDGNLIKKNYRQLLQDSNLWDSTFSIIQTEI